MQSSLLETTEPRTGEMGRPWEGGATAWTPSPMRAEPIYAEDKDTEKDDDPFDDFEEDDFDDDFDDDFEEDWEDDLTEDNEFPDTFGGHEDEKKAVPEKKAPFNDDPDFDKK